MSIHTKLSAKDEQNSKFCFTEFTDRERKMLTISANMTRNVIKIGRTQLDGLRRSEKLSHLELGRSNTEGVAWQSP